mgnify:CR=1 FL=1|tara:strand:- start:373 stop:696 length:324 start_codon:yes stop_codon:yes gene_type:complete
MFDPGDHSVKSAKKLLPKLNIEDLKKVLQEELDGKHRSSLVAAIGIAIDAIKTDEESSVKEEPAPEPMFSFTPIAGGRMIAHTEWERLPRHKRDLFTCVGNGIYKEQ